MESLRKDNLHAMFRAKRARVLEDSASKTHSSAGKMDAERNQSNSRINGQDQVEESPHTSEQKLRQILETFGSAVSARDPTAIQTCLINMRYFVANHNNGGTYEVMIYCNTVAHLISLIQKDVLTDAPEILKEVTWIIINFASIRGHFCAELIKAGLLDALSEIMTVYILPVDIYENIIWLLSNICSEDDAGRDAVCGSNVLSKVVELSNHIRGPRIDECLVWLYCGVFGGTSPSVLTENQATALATKLVATGRKYDSKNVLVDVFHGLNRYLSSSENIERQRVLLQPEFVDLLATYITSSDSEMARLCAEIAVRLARCLMYDQTELLTHPRITNELLRIAIQDKPVYSDELKYLSMEFITAMVVGSPKMMNSVVRDEKRLFEACGRNFVLGGSTDLLISCLNFITAYCFSESKMERLAGMLRSNPEVGI